MLCGTCGQPLEARRRDQRWCSAACRHQGYARAQVEALGRHLAALVFIDHVGQICPSGFLPLPVGNVRDLDLATVYREDPLFRALCDPARLGGRCGRCEYCAQCGGSRARAYAATGDPLAEDPGCVYQPAAGSTGTPGVAAIAVGPMPRRPQ